MRADVFIRLAIAAFLYVTQSDCVLAQERSKQQEIIALNNLQSQMSICLVFYQRVVTCGEGDKELTDIFSAASLILATAARSIGRRIGMTDEAMIARLKLIDQSHRQTIKNSCVNIASLIESFTEPCKTLVDGSASVLNEFLTTDLEKTGP